MPNQPHINDLLNSLGAIAEILDEFHAQLLKRGFDKHDALYLTGQFMAMFYPANQKGEEDADH